MNQATLVRYLNLADWHVREAVLRRADRDEEVADEHIDSANEFIAIAGCETAPLSADDITAWITIQRDAIGVLTPADL